MTVTMERSHTEERIDELIIRVDRGFAEVDRGFAEVDMRFVEVDRRFAEVNRRFDEVDRRFGEVDRRLDEIKEFQIQTNRRFELINAEFVALRGEMKNGFDRLHRTMLGFCGSLFAAVLAFVFTH